MPVAIPFCGAIAAAVAQSAKKAVKLFFENGLDGAADIGAQPVLNRIKSLFTCK